MEEGSSRSPAAVEVQQAAEKPSCLEQEMEGAHVRSAGTSSRKGEVLVTALMQDTLGEILSSVSCRRSGYITVFPSGLKNLGIYNMMTIGYRKPSGYLGLSKLSGGHSLCSQMSVYSLNDGIEACVHNSWGLFLYLLLL